MYAMKYARKPLNRLASDENSSWWSRFAVWSLVLSSRFRFELLDLRSNPSDEDGDKNYGYW